MLLKIMRVRLFQTILIIATIAILNSTCSVEPQVKQNGNSNMNNTSNSTYQYNNQSSKNIKKMSQNINNKQKSDPLKGKIIQSPTHPYQTTPVVEGDQLKGDSKAPNLRVGRDEVNEKKCQHQHDGKQHNADVNDPTRHKRKGNFGTNFKNGI